MATIWLVKPEEVKVRSAALFDGFIAKPAADIRVVGPGQVKPHVQRFADDVERATGAWSFGTYPGHQPELSLAIDIHVPMRPTTLGDAVAEFAIENHAKYGVWYVIWRQRIWNFVRGDKSWRAMGDRGDATQNHYDHLHLSFLDSAPIVAEEDWMADSEVTRLLTSIDGRLAWLQNEVDVLNRQFLEKVHPDRWTALAMIADLVKRDWATDND